ncbi:MAG: glycosyltransferase family 2 protein, partial [Bacteroidales bacterium]|nr:glycosyltransferase family 2 protein [Bacteroidales bacterium]
MLLSVVIVNYNVKAFLKQCLLSVAQSRGLEWGKDFEVFVVDNRSADGSVEMLREEFPQVRLIANKENLGFAKANNQAIRQSEARYVLLLNPDTLVQPDTLRTCLDFMEAHGEAGGLGVKMIDGQGHFLKESKRGLPTPRTAFYKISGLCKLFPRSERFASYY